MDSESHEINDPRVYEDSGTEGKVGPMTGGHPTPGVMEPETTESWGHGPFRVMVSPTHEAMRIPEPPWSLSPWKKCDPPAHIGTSAKFKMLQLM